MATAFPAIQTVDYHTAGEPFRIVTGGTPTPEGATVLDRRTWAQEHLDEARSFLINEPRGHADMYGGFVTPPDDDNGDLGVVFFHKDGFSTACGHGTIAVVTWAIDSGLIDLAAALETGKARRFGEETIVKVVVDAPSGRLHTEAIINQDGSVTQVQFWNVAAFVSETGITVATSHGPLTVDVSFGGAFYGSVALDDTDLELEASSLGQLIELGREIKAHFQNHPAVQHPTEARLSEMYGVIFHQDVDPATYEDPTSTLLHQRNVTVFADGEVDRSPCGSGTSARLALLLYRGQLRVGEPFLNEGIAGVIFRGQVESVIEPGTPSQSSESDNWGYGTEPDAPTLVGTSVIGSAYQVATCNFTLDPADPIGLGFQLR